MIHIHALAGRLFKWPDQRQHLRAGGIASLIDHCQISMRLRRKTEAGKAYYSSEQACNLTGDFACSHPALPNFTLLNFISSNS